MRFEKGQCRKKMKSPIVQIACAHIIDTNYIALTIVTLREIMFAPPLEGENPRYIALDGMHVIIHPPAKKRTHIEIAGLKQIII